MTKDCYLLLCHNSLAVDNLCGRRCWHKIAASTSRKPKRWHWC